MTAEFTKYEGLGNDFVVVDVASEAAADPERARRLCDRHFGIGADGVLWVLPATSRLARGRMLIHNADGSRPEMCGNGIRCIALHLALADRAVEARYPIETDAGLLECDVRRTGDVAEVTVGMGKGDVVGDYVADFAGRRVDFKRISMGNPHAVAFDTGDDVASIDRFAPELSAMFPEGSNIEFAVRRGPRELDLVVWERGVGRTLACGTGAAATGVAAALLGHAPFDTWLTVRLPGGPLQIQVASKTLAVVMRGPARRVFSGISYES